MTDLELANQLSGAAAQPTPEALDLAEKRGFIQRQTIMTNPQKPRMWWLTLAGQKFIAEDHAK